MTTTESGRRAAPAIGAWLPSWDLITTKNLEIRKRRGLIITLAVLTVAPTVLIYGLRLLFHLVDSHGYGLAGSPGLFSQLTNLTAEFGFIAAAALGAAAGTTDLSDGMFRPLVITGRSRLALYLARIPAGLAILIPVVALAFTVNCLVTGYESPPPPTTVGMSGLTVPEHLDQAGLQAWLLQRPQQAATSGLPLRLGPAALSATPAQVRSAIDRDITALYADYSADEISGQNPAGSEMAKIGLWLELDAGIGFLVGLGLGSLTGQRTTTTIGLIALEIIVTPLLAAVQIPLLHRRPAAPHRRRDGPAAPGRAGVGELVRRPRPAAVRRARGSRHTADADRGHDLGDRRLDHRLVRHRSMTHDDPRRLTGRRSRQTSTGNRQGTPARDEDLPVAINPPGHQQNTRLSPGLTARNQSTHLPAAITPRACRTADPLTPHEETRCT